MPIELGVSWLSAKAIKVARPKKVAVRKALGNSKRRENPRIPKQKKKDRQT